MFYCPESFFLKFNQKITRRVSKNCQPMQKRIKTFIFFSSTPKTLCVVHENVLGHRKIMYYHPH